jgi:hypothetical protein
VRTPSLLLYRIAGYKFSGTYAFFISSSNVL